LDKKQMRTKTILLTAALVAAGVASSMAQSSNVYSLNVVGYVNVPINPNYNLVAQQLDVGDGINSINTVLTNGTPDGTLAYQWNGAGYNLLGQYYVAGGNQWYDNNFNLLTNQVPPGTVLFLYNPQATASTVTLVGTVDQTTNTTQIVHGYGFYALDVPVASDLTTNGFPTGAGVDQTLYYSFNTVSGYSQPYTYYQAGNGWYDNNFNQVHPTPAIGAGFLLFNPSAGATWTQTFTVH
jgi:hypothetical protein